MSRPVTIVMAVAVAVAVLLAGCASPAPTAPALDAGKAPFALGNPVASEPVPNATVIPSPIAPLRSLPGPDGIVRLSLQTNEVRAQLADGVGYDFWTFGGTVPGPMLRVRDGDLVNITLANPSGSSMKHSIDLHAVSGPGGGAGVMQVNPGESKSFQFRAIHPGLYVYHCASPDIPSHVANGMYGMILVEPKEGLPPADDEFYVMEGEVYTTGALGEQGMQAFDAGKMANETPTYYVFNGRVGALTGPGALHAKVNDTVRIFFGEGGAIPSSFHVIGQVFDRVLPDGNGPAELNRQTILVPAAGDAIVEFKAPVPGSYTLVDHTLYRALHRGAVGQLMVEGPANPDVFDASTASSGH